MRKVLKSWINSAAGKVSAFLVIISISLLLLAWSTIGSGFLSERDATIANNILIGFATNLLGIVVTVSFVQYFLDRQNIATERKEEVAKIERYDKYMDTLIRRYLLFYMALTTRLENRKDIDIDKAYEHKFRFTDLADMYKMSLYICYGVLEPTVVLFYDAEKSLREHMVKMLVDIDFKYNQCLYEIIQAFVVKSMEFDMSGQILGNMKAFAGGKRVSDEVPELICDESLDWLGKYQRGELSGNMMLPYVIFYYHIQDQVKMIKEYKDYIKQIA